MSDLKPVQAYLNAEQRKWLSSKKKSGISKTALLASLVDEAMRKERVLSKELDK